MKIAWLNLALIAIGTMLLSTPSSYAHPASAAVAIVLDQSESMFEGESPTHGEIQRAAVISFLNHYKPVCADVRVSVIPWGDEPKKVYTATITSNAEAEAFAKAIMMYPLEKFGYTIHNLGFEAGLKQLRENEEVKIMVFTTDQAASPQFAPSNNLHRLVPSDVTLYAIGLGDTAVADYIATQVVIDTTKRWHVHTKEEFIRSLETVFSKIENQLCMY